MLDNSSQYLRQHPLRTLGALFVITFVVYSGSLANGFVYDDEHQILQNPFVFSPHLWPKIFVGSVWSFQGPAVQTNFYRPLQFFCYWLLYRVAGPNPGAFHMFQLLVYAATVWLVYALGRRLLKNEVVAFVGALFWALHPLHVEAVVWAAALPEVGFGFFYLLALLLFLRAEGTEKRRLAIHLAAAAAFLGALLFKEMALTLPLLLLAYWFFVSPQTPWRVRTTQLVPYVGSLAVYLVIRITVLGHMNAAQRPWAVSWKTLEAGVGLLGEHARLFFWPSGLSAFRTFDLESSLRSPWPWLALLLLIGAIWLRRREPAFGFLTLWWGIGLLPSLDIRQLSVPLVADRFSYVPSIGLCLSMAYLLVGWLPSRLPAARHAYGPVFLSGLVLLVWAVQVLRAVPRWHNNIILHGYSLQQSPGDASLHVAQAEILQFQEGDLVGAQREFQTALELNSRSLRPLPSVTYYAYLGLGAIAQRRGQTDVALDYFHRAARLLPNRSPAYSFLGAVYFPRGDYAQAAEHFAQGVRADPYNLVARFYLGTCLQKLGEYREAAEHFRTARGIDPSYNQAYEAEARALEAAGDRSGAAKVRSLLAAR